MYGDLRFTLGPLFILSPGIEWSRGESNPGPTGIPAFFSVRSLPELFLSLNLLGKLEIL